MYRFAIPAAIASLIALPVFAQDCTFTTECFEAEPCQDTNFSLSAQLGEAKLVTDFGDLTVVGVKSEAPLTTVFATGEGAEYLLSRTANAARFTAHSNDGPTSITYIGTCEGEF